MDDIPEGWGDTASDPDVKALYDHLQRLLGKRNAMVTSKSGAPFTSLSEELTARLSKLDAEIDDVRLRLDQARANFAARKAKAEADQIEKLKSEGKDEKRHGQRIDLDKERNRWQVRAVKLQARAVRLQARAVKISICALVVSGLAAGVSVTSTFFIKGQVKEVGDKLATQKERIDGIEGAVTNQSEKITALAAMLKSRQPSPKKGM